MRDLLTLAADCLLIAMLVAAIAVLAGVAATAWQRALDETRDAGAVHTDRATRPTEKP
jgi:hypothetical protein